MSTTNVLLLRPLISRDPSQGPPIPSLLLLRVEWDDSRDFPGGCDILTTFWGSESESEYSSLSVPSSLIFDSSLVVEDPSVA